MPQQGTYTEASLLDSLSSLFEIVDRATQEYFDYAKTCGACPEHSTNSGDDELATINGLWRVLQDMSKLLEDCQCTLQMKPATSEGNESVALDAAPPVVQSCKDAIDLSLRPASVGSLLTDDVLKLKMQLVRLERAIENGCKWTETRTGVLLYLSLLPAEPPNEFHQLDLSASEIRQWRAATRSQVQGGSEVDDASYCLTLLNATFNNREPEEYHREKLFVEHRWEAIPDYAKAATGWIPHADQSWTVLRPQVFALFNNSKSYNFVQWVLEFARQTWPATFGLDASCAGPQIELTNSLCNGTVAPIHVAAALGFSNLCQDLLSSGSGVNDDGALGTPLLCALLGSYAFADRLAGEPWDCPRDSLYSKPDRAKTVLSLLDAGADWKIRYKREGRKASLLFLAVWASFVTQNERILRGMNFGIADFDFALEEVLQFPELDPQNAEEKACLSRILTYIFDSYIKAASEDLLVLDLDDTMNRVIEDVVKRHSLDFPSLGAEPTPLDGIPAEQLYPLSELTVLQCQPFDLKRLVKDPRFNPNPEVSNARDSLLHIAVGADSQEMVEILLEAGADLEARDQAWRPPLLVVESVAMLATLVKHGASTTVTDWSGRNIWHFAAATNDMGLLSWLCENDPEKEKNLDKITTRGCSPLAEAFLLIEGLAGQPENALYPAEPVAARLLMEECKTEQSMESRVSLPHIAAEWGDLELINRLAAIGADFNQPDKNAECVLHHINFSASADVVQRLQELCHWNTQVNLGRQQTPAETIFSNFKPIYGDNHIALPSAHPSCRSVVSSEAYSLLLTPQTIASLNSEGDCLWKRWCDQIIGIGDMLTRYHRSDGATVLYMSTIAAMKCLIKAGVAGNYEKKNNSSAVMAFCKSERLHRDSHWTSFSTWPTNAWPVEHCHSLIQMTLENSSLPLLKDFCSSRKAMYLLTDAIVQGKTGLADFLIANGTVVFDLNGPFLERHGGCYAPLEWMTAETKNLVAYAYILKHVTAQQLTEGRFRILEALLQTDDDPVQRKKYAMLLKKGMDMSARPSKCHPLVYDPDNSNDGLLALAIGRRYSSEFCITLLHAGADARAKREDWNAAIWATEEGDLECLREIIKSQGEDFPWDDDVQEEGDDHRRTILHLAVQNADKRPEILELLLSETACISQINDTKRWWPVAIEAVKMALHDRTHQWKGLKILMRHGIDLTVGGEGWQTPIHYACMRFAQRRKLGEKGDLDSDVDLFRLLVSYEPRPVESKDPTGRKPLDYLSEYEVSDLHLYEAAAREYIDLDGHDAETRQLLAPQRGS